MAKSNKNRPVHEERLGRIKACVWKNDTENGTRYNVTYSRLYKDGDDWKESDSFGRDDNLLLARIAEIVTVWIYRHQQEETKEREAA